MNHKSVYSEVIRSYLTSNCLTLWVYYTHILAKFSGLQVN